tara:strand:- start:71 stop:697 length:627 start_codon:yes stop_codon:yes gene_type:complete
MSSIPYNYHKYIDDVTKMTQRGAISSGEQQASPSSAGSRGLAKTMQFTNNPTQMKMGNSPIAESMIEIRNILNRIDGINVPTQEEDYTPFPEADEFNIEEDEDFEEVLGPLGFPEDETELFDAEYRGRKVPLNKPMRGDVKKFKVYVKDPKTGNVKKVNFGHGGTSAKRPTMRIRKSNPKARKSFRARHNCANPGPKTKARYWSCRKW